MNANIEEKLLVYHFYRLYLKINFKKVCGISLQTERRLLNDQQFLQSFLS